MKKITILLLIVLTVFATSCTSDSDYEGVNSSIQIDGIKFKPNKAVYSYLETSFETEKKIKFVISNEKKQEHLNIEVITQSSRESLTGIYPFFSSEYGYIQVFVEFYVSEKRYAIALDFLKITDLGGSKFKLEFGNASAYDKVKNIRIPFEGMLEGKILLEKTK